MDELSLESKIEGFLFYKGEEVSKKELLTIFKVTEEQVEQAMINLESLLQGRGLVILKNDNKYKLGISKELSPLIESIHKEELAKELSKASLETLSIILYLDGVARSEIDYIRGVNSSFILRNLLIRGLIEKKNDPNDSRRFLYFPTIDVLSYMGVTQIESLPNYLDIKEKLKNTINNQSKLEEKNA